ncbi:Fic family protein [Haliscomenobacter hydrossis]|uniref:Filamentation induced by cAMP protein Fic n=1 Tax=Haliscomenobacter hydrossis (strain ATCC 27775 / DSM 1100 / LMG 10767 / O) TaxID=760192 RepID=F4L6N1_HALH1|nr:Fic family protein [Haliscomenobacter hydrossis]AEE50862.1 filamentation induced by cAMP protein Fic [Haliscomenobacter hydrossis DSM 1100]
MIDLEAYSALPIVDQINALHQQIESLRPISPEQEQRILQKYRLDWNYHSNAIEGNSLTYGETRAFLMHGLTAKGKPLKDHLDIRGHNQAIDLLYRMIKDETEITETDIRSLHEVILVEPYEVDTQTNEGIPAKKRIQLGVYKTSPNHVITKTGETHYYATPEDTPILMGELMETYRQNKANSKVHPAILAAYFHYRITAIHPFDDGNGRMARLMMNLLLMKAGYPPVIIRQEKANREAYYYALSQADAGEYIPFFELIGEALVHSMELYVKGAKGESLEEPDDILKELDLIKREIKTNPDRVIADKTRDNLGLVNNKSVQPLIEGIQDGFKGFQSDIFVRHEISAIFIKEDNSIHKIQKTSYINSVMLALPKLISITYDFINLQSSLTPFTIRWNVEFSLETLSYFIQIYPEIISHDKSIPYIDLKKLNTSNFFECDPSQAFIITRFFPISNSDLTSPIKEKLNTLVVLEKKYNEYLTKYEIDRICADIQRHFIIGIKALHMYFQ